jgi:hypothetical protein
MSDDGKKISVEVAASPFWAVALILFWLSSCSDGKRVMNAVDPQNARPIQPYEGDVKK